MLKVSIIGTRRLLCEKAADQLLGLQGIGTESFPDGGQTVADAPVATERSLIGGKLDTDRDLVREGKDRFGLVGSHSGTVSRRMR